MLRRNKGFVALDVDLVLLALGFLGPEEGPITELGLKTDESGARSDQESHRLRRMA